MTEFSQTDAQFQAEFRAFEPDFDFLASFGDTVLPALEELLDGEDELLAQRAVYVAGLLDAGAGLPLLEQASKDPRETVRVAVAGAIRSQSIQTMSRSGNALADSSLTEIVNRLLSDGDPSVRRWASKSAGILGLSSAKTELERLEREDAEAFVRSAATQALKQVSDK
jgi:HEAT repeat protein